MNHPLYRGRGITFFHDQRPPIRWGVIASAVITGSLAIGLVGLLLVLPVAVQLPLR